MPYLDIDGIKLFYQCKGSGSPPVVFVHGFACSHDDWRHQLDYFAESNLTLACDLRGHGRSSSGPGECTIEILADDLAHLLRNLNIPPAFLVGHSMGCRVVLQTCSAMPELVIGLILVDGSRLATGNRQDAEQRARRAMQDTGYVNWMYHAFASMFFSGNNARWQASILKRATALPEKVGLPLFASLCGWDAGDVEQALTQVKVPLMLIQSTTVNASMERVSLQPGDSIPWAELVKSHMPEARLEIVSGVGHFTMLEAPEAINQLIDSFLTSS